MVEICIHPMCSNQTCKENKANSYKWFTEEHFSVSILSCCTALPLHSNEENREH